LYNIDGVIPKTASTISGRRRLHVIFFIIQFQYFGIYETVKKEDNFAINKWHVSFRVFGSVIYLRRESLRNDSKTLFYVDWHFSGPKNFWRQKQHNFFWFFISGGAVCQRPPVDDCVHDM
jgi:hypothetical protein